ncbi:MAG TPA: dihydrolipoamide acetyltransferase family protein [Bacteroidota bacterium]|jgi:2-oxoglutarate dehydrogenase E2 component (dihydrolipoamide succinyltransferase)|nr:dihydrolipoamide acetyltransferase family protein [Bacteroidota bacterium]
MSKVEVVMPQLGESLTEGTIIKWHKKPGDKVKKDETLLEISTDKVDSEIPSPTTGVVTKLLFNEQQTVAVRTAIAEIDTDENATPSQDGGKPQAAPAQAKAPEPAPAQPAPVQEAKPVAPQPAPQPSAASPQSMPAAPQSTDGGAGRFYSPLVLNIAREENISMGELEQIPGTGEGGRVSKKDILAYVETRKKGGGAPAGAPSHQPPVSAPPRIENMLKHVESGDLAKKFPAPQHEILQMSNLIQKMADHMVKSKQTSPHVYEVHECDMTKIDTVRRRNGDAFEKREGFKLTYMPFICDAVVQALKQFPLVNAQIEGDKIVIKRYVNLGIAVATENGLIVPVIKNADEKNFTGLARSVNDLATRARSKKLAIADIEGGSFTITNYGGFGAMIGTPIINQPQVAILGIGTIKKRPVVINDAIAIRSISYFTLSFDHRIIDGALGGSFLSAVIKQLENVDEKLVV